MNKKFAVFDIDGTLIRWQLFHAIVHHLGQQGFIDKASHDAISEARMEWKKRSNEKAFTDYEHVMLNKYLDSLTKIYPENHSKIVDEVFEEYKDQLFVYSKNLLTELKAKGYLIFAISGSQQDIVDKFAKYHGFTEVIGAKFTIKNGKFTGEVESPVTNKQEALSKLLAKYDVTYKDSYAIGDTASDIPMLQMVENPIAFNPTKELLETAKNNHWPVVIERKSVVYKLLPKDDQYYLS